MDSAHQVASAVRFTPLRADVCTPAVLRITLDRCLARKVIVIRPASHLGFAAPDHLTLFPAQLPDALR
jgi:hypothetical protein